MMPNVSVDYIIERMEGIITRSDLDDFMYELDSLSLSGDLPNDEVGFDVHKAIDDVKADYILRALKETNGNQTKAAKLLGLKSYQTLQNWMVKLGMEFDANEDEQHVA